MAVTISTKGKTATIDGYRWTSDDEALVAVLNAMLPEFGPSGADPDPDYTAAQRAVAEMGGEIINAHDPLPFDPDVIY